MIRPFAILANVLGSLSYFLGLTAFVYWIAQWSCKVFEMKLPVEFSGVMELVLGPFLLGVRHQFGIQTQKFSGVEVDMSLCILVLVFFSVFMLCLSLGSLLNTIDAVMSKTYRKLEHDFYVWKVDQEEKKEVVTQRVKPEKGALLAIKLENIDNEAFLASVNRCFSMFGEEVRVIDHHRDKVLQFASTFHALVFSRQFSEQFEDLLRQYEYFEDESPYFRVAIQTLATVDHISQEHKYLHDLIKCVGPNQIYLGLEAKTQLEVAEDQQTKSLIQQFMYAGTFYKLGHREFAEAFRYCLNGEEGQRFT